MGLDACSRVFVAIVSGCAAGIMGLTGIIGFLTFFLTTFILSVMMYVKMGMQPKPYFKKAEEVWTEGVMQALMVRARRRASRASPSPAASPHGSARPCRLSPVATCCVHQSYILFWTLFYDIVHIY